jgi:hypothetical protein
MKNMVFCVFALLAVMLGCASGGTAVVTPTPAGETKAPEVVKNNPPPPPRNGFGRGN